MDAIEIFNRYANEYLEKNGNVSSYAEGLSFFCEALPKNAKILELACGPGNISRYLIHQRPDFTLTATDPAQKMIALAQKQGLNVDFHCEFANKALKRGRFNGIVCGFLLPYLNPDEFFELLHQVYLRLEINGHLYLSWINKTNTEKRLEINSKGEELEITYYSIEFIQKSLRKLGFSIEYKKLQKNSSNKDMEGIIVGKKWRV